MHTSKSIPNFQFKIRFNPFYNSWEVWTYLAGETNPAKARWMLCTKDTAIWYETTKNAKIVAFEPTVEDRLGNDVLVEDVVQAITRKHFDSRLTIQARAALVTWLKIFQKNTELEKDPDLLQIIKDKIRIIKGMEEHDKAFDAVNSRQNNVSRIAHS